MCEEEKGTVNPSNKQNLLYHFEKLWIWDLDIPSHIPWKVNHGYYGLHALQLIPLVPFHCQLVLAGCTNTELQKQLVRLRNNYQPRSLCYNNNLYLFQLNFIRNEPFIPTTFPFFKMSFKKCIYVAQRTQNTTAATNTCEDKLLTSVQFLCWTGSSISKTVNQ